MNNNFNIEKLHDNHIALFRIDGEILSIDQEKRDRSIKFQQKSGRNAATYFSGFRLVTVIGSSDYFVKCSDVRSRVYDEDFAEIEATAVTHLIDRRLVVGCSECNGEIRRAWYILVDFAQRNFNASVQEVSKACVNVLLDDDKRREYLDFLDTIEHIEKLLGQTRKTYDLLLVRDKDGDLLQDIGAAIDRFEEALTDIHNKQLDFFFDLFALTR